jgi:hypothetical protein
MKNISLAEGKITDDIAQLRKTGVLVYGAGKIGSRLIQACRYFDIPVHVLWDQRADDLGVIEGIPVSRPVESFIPDHLRNIPTLMTVFQPVRAAALKSCLEKQGLEKVITDRMFFNALSYHECRTQQSKDEFVFDLNKCIKCPLQKDNTTSCNIFDAQLMQASSQISQKNETQPLIVRNIGLLITSKCNLTCIGCNHLRDLYEKKHNIVLHEQDVLNDLDRLLESIDFLKTLTLVGGEAFVHQHVDEIIQAILEKPKIGMLHVITNGTVVPKPKVIEILRDPRVFVEVSGYGDSIGQHLISKRDTFLRIMDEKGINYKYGEFYEWTDFGDFEDRGYSEDKIKEVYHNCCFVSNDIFNGELHKCSRSAYGKFIGKIPDFPLDYVNLRAYDDPIQRRKRLLEFFADERPRVCNRCNGTSELTIEAGVQLPLKEKAAQMRQNS